MCRGLAQAGTRAKIMPFAIRTLEERDIPQSTEIEHDAFPALFPPTSFRRELRNGFASYLVVWRRDEMLRHDGSAPCFPDSRRRVGDRPLANMLLNSVRGLWQGRRSDWQAGHQRIVGFLGIWYVVDEAHIVSLGVRSGYRGRGIGELLLIGATEQAMAKRARVVTLEVRESNHTARNLYLKYGFKERGTRKGYYADNGEDAIIMTTGSMHSSSYAEEFRKLVQEHEQRWGRAERVLC